MKAFFLSIFLLLFSCDPVFAQDSTPDIPPINQRESWFIDQIPANLTVVYRNQLRVAYPVLSGTPFVFEETFKENDGLWYFQAPCTIYQRIVRPTPIAWRWRDDQEWQPYIQKTWR